MRVRYGIIIIPAFQCARPLPRASETVLYTPLYFGTFFVLNTFLITLWVIWTLLYANQLFIMITVWRVSLVIRVGTKVLEHHLINRSRCPDQQKNSILLKPTSSCLKFHKLKHLKLFVIKRCIGTDFEVEQIIIHIGNVMSLTKVLSLKVAVWCIEYHLRVVDWTVI